MFLGYQNNKIKFYTENALDEKLYNLDRIEETHQEYVYDEDKQEYVLKDAAWEEKQAQKERERINCLSLTKREVLLALYDDKGITPEQIKAQLDERGKIEFDYADEYYRGNPLINAIGEALGYSSAQLDYLFEKGKM